jgi:hypothetical protein
VTSRAAPPTRDRAPKRRAPAGIEKFVTQLELAHALGLSDRQIRNLEDSSFEDGLPRREANGYPLGSCVQWYVRWKVQEAVARASASRKDDLSALQLREQVAKVERSELALRRERGDLVEISAYRDAAYEMAMSLRTPIDTMDGEHALRILHISDAATARVRLGEVKSALLRALQAAVERIGIPMPEPAE